MQKSNFQLLRMISIFCAFLTVSYAQEVGYQITPTIPKNYDEWVKQGKLFNPALLSFMVWNYKYHKWVSTNDSLEHI